MEDNVQKFPEDLIPTLFPESKFPIEIVRKILQKFPIDDLEDLRAVSKAWRLFINELCLIFYRSAFKDSVLWEHIPHDKTTSTISLRSYFATVLSKKTLQKIPEYLEDLESFLLKSLDLSDKSKKKLLVSINCDFLLAEEKDLIKVRQENQKESIQVFLKYPPAHWLQVARAYQHIEAALTLLMLHNFAKDDICSLFSTRDVVFFILDKRLTCWLTGSGLYELVNELGQEKLLSDLIACSFGKGPLLLIQSIQEQTILQENAQDILSRLTDYDLFLLQSDTNHRLVLVDAIKQACLPIIYRLGVQSLERIIEENNDEEILSVLLKYLGIAQLAMVLSNLPSKRFKIVCSDTEFMRQLLAPFTITKLCEWVNLLTSPKLAYLLDSQAFLEFLEAIHICYQKRMMPNDSIESIVKINLPSQFQKLSISCSSSTLLTSFVEFDSAFADEIIKSRCSKFLTPSDILQLLEKYSYKWDLLKESNLLEKFTTDDLLQLMRIEVKAVEVVSHQYLDKFTVTDLHAFYLTYHDNQQVPLSARKKIYNECKKRLLVQKEQEEKAQLLINAQRMNSLYGNSKLKRDTPIFFDKRIVFNTHTVQTNFQSSPQKGDEASDVDQENETWSVAETSNGIQPKVRNLNCEEGETEPLLKSVPTTKAVPHPARFSWLSWLMGGLLILAGADALLSTLGLLQIPFAVTVCAKIINAFFSCTPEAAVWTIFTAGLILGAVACAVSLIQDCLYPLTVSSSFSSDNGNDALDNGKFWNDVHRNQYIQDPSYHNNKDLLTATTILDNTWKKTQTCTPAKMAALQ